MEQNVEAPCWACSEIEIGNGDNPVFEKNQDGVKEEQLNLYCN